MQVTDQKIDVICQNCKDGSIIPIKIRMQDEDGILQQYLIKSYREVAAVTDGYTMPNKVHVGQNPTKRKYECRVSIFNKMHRIYLIFNTIDLTWRLEV